MYSYNEDLLAVTIEPRKYLIDLKDRDRLRKREARYKVKYQRLLGQGMDVNRAQWLISDSMSKENEIRDRTQNIGVSVQQ